MVFPRESLVKAAAYLIARLILQAVLRLYSIECVSMQDFV